MSELEDWRKSDTRTLNFIEEKIPVMTPQVKIIQVFCTRRQSLRLEKHFVLSANSSMQGYMTEFWRSFTWKRNKNTSYLACGTPETTAGSVSESWWLANTHCFLDEETFPWIPSDTKSPHLIW